MSMLKFSEQIVLMVSPTTDDRLRTLAQKHGASVAKAARVALHLGLRPAEMLDTDLFERTHLALEAEARRRHADCSGSWHTED